MIDWHVPSTWETITTIDAHTAGEPLRIITGGVPEIPGSTILEKRAYVKQNLDFYRMRLMFEPRGHADMYGAILTEPVTPDGDYGVLFLHNEGLSSMCGHGIIALTKVLLDTGMVVRSGDDPVLKFDTPAGRVTATAQRLNGTVHQVSFENVPSFVYRKDLVIPVSGMGDISLDIAFGGAFYAFVDADNLGLPMDSTAYSQLIDKGRRVKQAVMEQVSIVHPVDSDLGFLYGTIFTGKAHAHGNHSRNVCIFAEGEVDRSPTGTGVSARAAIHVDRDEIGMNQAITVESILGTCFQVAAIDRVSFGPYTAVVPRVTGSAHITGRHEFTFDPDDPLVNGFIFR